MRLVASSTHGVVSSSVGSPQNDADMWHTAIAHRTDKLGSFFDEARSFGFEAYHKAGYVVEKDYWCGSGRERVRSEVLFL